jgi:hypothetical protein
VNNESGNELIIRIINILKYAYDFAYHKNIEYEYDLYFETAEMIHRRLGVYENIRIWNIWERVRCDIYLYNAVYINEKGFVILIFHKYINRCSAVHNIINRRKYNILLSNENNIRRRIAIFRLIKANIISNINVSVHWKIMIRIYNNY